MGRARHIFLHGVLGQRTDTATKCASSLNDPKPPSLTRNHQEDLDAYSSTSEATTVTSCDEPLHDHATRNDIDEISNSSNCHNKSKNKRHRCASMIDSTGKHARHVEFGNVQVRVYEQVVGDHPQCQSGCPLALGWNYHQEPPAPLSAYEQQQHGESLLNHVDLCEPNNKEEHDKECFPKLDLCHHHNYRHRSLEELRLSDQERHDRLVAHDVSAAEIRHCLRRLYRERECSVRCHGHAKAQFFT